MRVIMGILSIRMT